MTEKQTENILQFLIKHSATVISIIVGTAVAVFWILNYVNAPIQSINMHLNRIDVKVAQIQQVLEDQKAVSQK